MSSHRWLAWSVVSAWGLVAGCAVGAPGGAPIDDGGARVDAAARGDGSADEVDAGADGAPVDAPADAATDAAVDAGVDAGVDAPPKPPPAWTELGAPTLDVEGGVAAAPAGVGRAGGQIRLRSRGALTIDPAQVAPPASAMGAVPSGGAVVAAAALGADLTGAGTLRISGLVTASGADAVRTITAADGDLIVDGTLRGADLGGRRQGLALRAPRGTVFVLGAVDAGGDDGLADGDAGGPIELSGRRVVVVGRVTAAGEASAAGRGGAGGAVRVVATAGAIWMGSAKLISAGGAGALRGGDAGGVALQASGALWLTGAIDSAGGDARGGGAATGGRGGTVALAAGGAISLGAAVRVRGGAATGVDAAAGGAAGALRLDAGGAAWLGGVVDGRGGVAVATGVGAAVVGGAAGEVVAGAATPPATIAVCGALVAAGGGGLRLGGAGGRVELLADGDVALIAPIDVRGGRGGVAPGAAGAVLGVAGPHAGGIRLVGRIVGVGGAAALGTDADGGAGGQLRLEITSRAGDLVIAPGGVAVFDGGRAAGAGRAGAGGGLTLRTMDGNASMAGRLWARGGGGGALGRGGGGGALELFTDANFDGRGGDLIVEPTGRIDVSGGAGGRGGSARNNGGVGVALFPAHQEQLAVLLNSDGIHGSPRDGDLVNRGQIIARGGASGGAGGDVMFHGRRPNSFEDPLPGVQFLAGDGAGRSGDFAAE